MSDYLENLHPVIKDTLIPSEPRYEVMRFQYPPSGQVDSFALTRIRLWNEFSLAYHLPFINSYDCELDPQRPVVQVQIWGPDLQTSGLTEDDLVAKARRIEEALFEWSGDGQPEISLEEFRGRYMHEEIPVILGETSLANIQRARHSKVQKFKEFFRRAKQLP
jgi:hypothetical protein